MYLGEMFIEMVITIEQFTCGFLPKILNNCFSSDVLTAKIHGQGFGISLVLATYLPVIHRLYQLGKNTYFSRFFFCIVCISTDEKFN